jgi:dTDP-4-amino-4,6-dideoxygalactose transaminase
VNKDEGPWYQEVQEFGLNYRLPDLLAALGSSQLRRLGEFKARRAVIKTMYDSLLEDIEGITLPAQRGDVDPTWHLYPIRVPPAKRRAVFDYLRNAGIGVQVNYIPAYWHPAFDASEYPRGLCPEAESFYSQEISLPMHVELLDLQIERVADSVRSALTS